MDEVAAYNQQRWKALTEANALFTRPKLNLDAESARRIVDPEARLGELNGKNVLCLAGGGGQQSAAFAILGAQVSVLDLSAEQLERDRAVARHYQKEIKVFEGDMRNLDCFEAASFDLVYHAYSINFVPDATQIFRQVARILRTGGLYQFNCANPFLMGIQQNDWNGEGYVLKNPYFSDEKISYDDQDWVYDKTKNEPLPKPIEYRHRLSDLISGLVDWGLMILSISDTADLHPDLHAEPKSWEHFMAFIPPWLSFLTKKV